jgi:adenylyltransferase/sulfurtransferase
VNDDDRYDRLERIDWWDQALLRDARVLVVGAGALGNEVLKNLALVGLKHVVVVDLDTIENSNLTRSVLFRESDVGSSKPACAARMMREICPDVDPVAIEGNVLCDIGLGYFRWAHVVVGALDNREARVFLNSACYRVGRPWFDGGIEVLQGIVRGFSPPETACYECTMSSEDWKQLSQTRSCSLIERRAAQHSGTPTTPTTASIIGAIQAQEVIKHLHEMDSLAGKGFFYDGEKHSSYAIEYQIKPDCVWHASAPKIESVTHFTSDSPLREMGEYGAERLGGLDAIDLGREQVSELRCLSCGRLKQVWCPVEKISADMATCDACETELTPEFFHTIDCHSPLLDKSPRELGLPIWDIVWPRCGEEMLGLEIAGDAPLDFHRIDDKPARGGTSL